MQKKSEAPEKVQAGCCESQGLSASRRWPCAPSGQIKGTLGAGGFGFKASSLHSQVSRGVSVPSSAAWTRHALRRLLSWPSEIIRQKKASAQWSPSLSDMSPGSVHLFFTPSSRACHSLPLQSGGPTPCLVWTTAKIFAHVGVALPVASCFTLSSKLSQAPASTTSVLVRRSLAGGH